LQLKPGLFLFVFIQVNRRLYLKQGDLSQSGISGSKPTVSASMNAFALVKFG